MLISASSNSILPLSAIISPLNKFKKVDLPAALDPKTSNIILEKTKEIVEQNKNTITFMITHNMEDAIKYGNRLIMLHKGKIVYDVRNDEKNKLMAENLLGIFNDNNI